MHILVTNDDGVHAPGLASLTRGLADWAAARSHQVVVVAPMANHSGASAAVGTVYERESISYVAARVEGATHVPAYGLDGSPALSVIVAVLGGFGPRPDLIVSGINLGVNVGRSVLHSGTVGAVLTGAQLGVRGLAVSLRSGGETDHFDTAATLATRMLDVLAAAPERTVLNLNVPSLPLSEIRGVRRGRVGGAGLIRAAVGARRGDDAEAAAGEPRWPPPPGEEEGEIRLRLGAAVPRLGEVGVDHSLHEDEVVDDAVLVSHGWASLTALVGVREEGSDGALAVVEAARRAAVAPDR